MKHSSAQLRHYNKAVTRPEAKAAVHLIAGRFLVLGFAVLVTTLFGFSNLGCVSTAGSSPPRQANPEQITCSGPDVGGSSPQEMTASYDGLGLPVVRGLVRADGSHEEERWERDTQGRSRGYEVEASFGSDQVLARVEYDYFSSGTRKGVRVPGGIEKTYAYDPVATENWITG